VSTAPFNVGTPYGTLLLDVTQNVFIEVVPAGTPFNLRIPDAHSFIGIPAHAQAVSLSPFELTNALDLVLGTY